MWDSCNVHPRFILPDRATTVVSTPQVPSHLHCPQPLTPPHHPLLTPHPLTAIPQGETLRSLVSRLLEKRGLKFTSFDAFLAGQDKPLDLSEDCSNLGCSEVSVTASNTVTTSTNKCPAADIHRRCGWSRGSSSGWSCPARRASG